MTEPKPKGELSTSQPGIEQVYRETRDSMAGYLVCLGLPASQAQEVTQEVFLRLHQALRNGQKIQDVRAWLFRVAHNLGLNTRARERYRNLADPDWERFVNPETNSPEDTALSRERSQLLIAALKDLSPQQRNCLFLRAEGLRYREIAEVLRIKPSTVGEFLTRAIQRLTEALHG
ncbi:MAG TPA: sigma-70 family RNA polymerase sigma factor [Bryobacteraceae bacterium]|jgi:RNA polymerase sigma-70 factor (ECF subfamily)|nr:sigma-70 family RNA polymerase sigma factor [Bryobacteraceae bacterium]